MSFNQLDSDSDCNLQISTLKCCSVLGSNSATRFSFTPTTSKKSRFEDPQPSMSNGQGERKCVPISLKIQYNPHLLKTRHFHYFHFTFPCVNLMYSLSSPGRLPLFLCEFFGMVVKLVLYRGVTVSLLVLPLLLLCMQQNSSQHSVSVPGSAQHLYFKPEDEHSTKPKCCKECYQTCMLCSIIRSDGSFNTYTETGRKQCGNKGFAVKLLPPNLVSASEHHASHN